MMEERRNEWTIITLGVVVLTVVFAVLLLIASPRWIRLTLLEGQLELPVLVGAFFFSLVFAFVTAQGILIQLIQYVHNISPLEATRFLNRLLFGLWMRPPLKPLLRVQEGRANPEGPEVLLKLGGPGFLSIGHDSVVVTSRFGQLERVLGPGLHKLAAFEKVWDVVDLRPQRRSVDVSFMTRDGIPVRCQADVRFRIDSGGQPATEKTPYPFSPEAVFKATTVKRRRADGTIQDWMQRISSGSLDGEIHDQLEKYTLDRFLEPAQGDVPFIAQLQEEIFDAVCKGGEKMGIQVEQVQLGPVMPDAPGISRQWLETWQSRWQRTAAELLAQEEATQTQLVELARVQAAVDLITEVIPVIQRMEVIESDLDGRVIALHFLDVLRALSDREPIVQHQMFQQAEQLRKMLATIQEEYIHSEHPGDYPALTQES